MLIIVKFPAISHKDPDSPSTLPYLVNRDAYSLKRHQYPNLGSICSLLYCTSKNIAAAAPQTFP
jgi:hypothetical protein